jgi:hypothetical protein
LQSAVTAVFSAAWQKSRSHAEAERQEVPPKKNQGEILERRGPENVSGRYRRNWWSESRAFGEVMLFSATVFLSGTRFFVGPPHLPQLEGRLAAHAGTFFVAERVCGALFSILFFLAISGTVVR